MEWLDRRKLDVTSNGRRCHLEQLSVVLADLSPVSASGAMSGNTSAYPWQQPFWKPAKGKTGVFWYLILIHVLAVVGIILFPAPSLTVMVSSLLLACLGGLGTTVCYHRALAHRSLRLNSVVEHVLTFWAMFNGSGAPASWVAYHRRHHLYADTPADISSPVFGGFWWSHLRWLYQTGPADPRKWCPELNKGGRWYWEHLQIPIVAVSLLCGLPFGLQAFFWVGAMRLVYSLHMQCFVNSVTHLGKSEQGISSQNIWWLGPLQLSAWGENWHGNHHANAGSARLGLSRWQVDIGWYFIRLLEVTRLARNVRGPRAAGIGQATART